MNERLRLRRQLLTLLQNGIFQFLFLFYGFAKDMARVQLNGMDFIIDILLTNYLPIQRTILLEA